MTVATPATNRTPTRENCNADGLGCLTDFVNQRRTLKNNRVAMSPQLDDGVLRRFIALRSLPA